MINKGYSFYVADVVIIGSGRGLRIVQCQILMDTGYQVFDRKRFLMDGLPPYMGIFGGGKLWQTIQVKAIHLANELNHT